MGEKRGMGKGEENQREGEEEKGEKGGEGREGGKGRKALSILTVPRSLLTALMESSLVCMHLANSWHRPCASLEEENKQLVTSNH